VLLGWCQELGAPRAPLGVTGLDVLDPDVEEAAHPIWVGLRLERHCRLVVGRATSEVDDDPSVGQCEVQQLAVIGLQRVADVAECGAIR
jgi:hypothetical protein